MGRKLARVLDTELVESYLKLDADQIGSKAVKKKFAKVRSHEVSLTNPGKIFCWP